MSLYDDGKFDRVNLPIIRGPIRFDIVAGPNWTRTCLEYVGVATIPGKELARSHVLGSDLDFRRWVRQVASGLPQGPASASACLHSSPCRIPRKKDRKDG